MFVYICAHQNTEDRYIKMTVCAVPFCKKVLKKGCGVKFHKFSQNKHWKNVWYQKIKRLRPLTKRSTICSQHFTDDDYFISKSGKLENIILSTDI